MNTLRKGRIARRHEPGPRHKGAGGVSTVKAFAKTAMRRQVIALAMTATAAQAWVPLPSFSGLTRGFGAADFAATPMR